MHYMYNTLNITESPYELHENEKGGSEVNSNEQ